MSVAERGADPAITGIGAVTPLGLDARETWRGLVSGASGIGPVTSFDPSGLPVRIAGEVKGFDPDRLLGVKRARRSARRWATPPMASR